MSTRLWRACHSSCAKKYAAYVTATSTRFTLIEGTDIDIGVRLFDCGGWEVAEWHDHDEAGAMVFRDVGLMGAEAESERVAAATRRLRVFAGYAGWSAGQLDGELEQEAWIVEDARPDDPFGEGDLWSDVLVRKGGQYALLARMPDDPSLN